MSKLLNTGLDGETLMTCVRLCEGGVNPEALARVIKELRRESAAIKVRVTKQNHILMMLPIGGKKKIYIYFV